MSLELLELGAEALGPLVEEVVFVGGASVVLWITDPAAPPPRPTNDVDVIVEVTGRWGYEQFSKRLRATKLEAFADRGRDDLLGSHDFEDAISLINGRDALVEEVRAAADDLRAYLAQQITRLQAIPRFDEWVAGALRPDAANQARVEAIVLPRLAEIIDSA